MHAQDLDDADVEIKASFHKFWYSVCQDMFDHEVVGWQLRPPAAADKSRHAQPFMLVWQWLIKEAAHTDRKRNVSGYVVFLRRGQVAVSYRYLAKLANWHVSAVRAFMERLAAFDMVQLSATHDADQLVLGLGTGRVNLIQKGTPPTVVTICNYGKYQAPRHTKRHTQRHSLGTKPYIYTSKESVREGFPAGLPEGDYTPLGHGAWLNCDSIWHPEFTISLRSAEMQFALTSGVDKSKAADTCKAAALQWAAAIEGGQKPREVVPGNIIGALVAGARRGAYGDLEGNARLARASPGARASAKVIAARQFQELAKRRLTP